MKALTHGRYRGLDGNAAVFDVGAFDVGAFDVGAGTKPLATIRVAILERDIGRVTLRRTEGYRLDRGWAIAPNGLEPPFEGRARDDVSGFANPAVTAREEGGTVTLVAPGLSATVTLHPFGIAWRRDGEAEPFLSDRPTQAYFLSRKSGALAHSMARHADERHYGLGDKAGPLDRTGRRFAIDAVDPCGFDAELSDPLYKMLPFFIVDGPVGAHGVYYDNLATGAVDLGCTIDNYHGLFRSYQANDGDLDYYVLAGPSVPEVVRRFSWLAGGQAFAPRWSLGFAMTSMSIADAPDADARVSAFVADCKTNGIRCDSFHFGSGYTSIGPRRYVFNWNHDKFPDPTATMARLKAAGMQPVTNIKPCLLDDHPRLEEAKRDGILVTDGSTGEPAVAQFWDGLGFHVDFTNPKGRDWWANGIRSQLLDYGVVSIWSDNNEFEIWDEDAVCAGDGRPFAQSLARPAQALLMHKLAYETQVAHAPGKRPYVITRAGGAGISRYGQTWTGDNETAWKTLRFNLTQGLNMSLSGLFNIGHDVGGFHGPVPGPELFCRFVEFCALWPRMVMNSWKDNGTVNTPWMHPEVLAEVRAVIALRHSLIPYLYTQMWRASREDMPAVKPLFWDFPADDAARGVEDAFMLGPDLLVAPVLEEGATARDVYLPAHPGGWYDWHDLTHWEGGRIVRVEAPLGRLPLFARAGAIIPVAEGDETAAVVFGTSADGASGLIYSDDGETADWRRDGEAITLSLRPDEDGFVLEAQAPGALKAISVRAVGVPGLRVATAGLVVRQ
ncbi:MULTISPECIES: glycoside hydrolase family 31 protein [unclassified Chelatococcus]|uniref:glycoside hydrolase family 31 protein n=1 Tax=unclassified Chelatococcus TaxID=2638111 RepID=UPI001BCE1CDF|nr:MULTISPECIES: glycoside hydrolase family 31 protein [unclassified Chelatococcus]MBS7697436.1 glycoside hydrolase family 31 protein [Chelatococcus sp. YT9]MBX3559253.1 glycoside hydrolase family 31 protein [Chelatococcus sp.]